MLTKQMIKVLDERVPNTRYDQFFVEQFVKKVKSNEEMEQLIDMIQHFSEVTILDELANLSNTVNN